MFSLAKNVNMKKSIALFVVNRVNLKTLKHNTFLKKQYFLLFVVNVRMKMKKYLKKKNRLR